MIEILKASFSNCFYLTFDTLHRHFSFCLAYLCLSAGGVWSDTKNKKIKFFTSEQNAQCQYKGKLFWVLMTDKTIICVYICTYIIRTRKVFKVREEFFFIQYFIQIFIYMSGFYFYHKSLLQSALPFLWKSCIFFSCCECPTLCTDILISSPCQCDWITTYMSCFHV